MDDLVKRAVAAFPVALCTGKKVEDMAAVEISI